MLSHLPEMHVMDLRDAVNINNRIDDAIGIDFWWTPQHQGMDYSTNFGKREIEDIRGD